MYSLKPALVNIVSWDGGGLGTDIDVLSSALSELGCTVLYKGRRQRVPQNRLQSLVMTGMVMAQQGIASVVGYRPFDLNIFVESIFPEYLSLGRTNWLLANPEFFRKENEAYLASLDGILCKTPSGVDAFRSTGVPCRYIAFSSPDKVNWSVARKPLECLHVAGASELKNTGLVVDAWSRNPQWPQLTVIRRNSYGSSKALSRLPDLANVRYFEGCLTSEQLIRIQNESGIHVIPSQAEGYGHILGEGMSCGAVVVTTDAAPMNELVTRERGALVKVDRSEPMLRGTKNYVDISNLESTLTDVFAMSQQQREQLGINARRWYEAQHGDFLGRLRSLVEEAVSKK